MIVPLIHIFLIFALGILCAAVAAYIVRQLVEKPLRLAAETEKPKRKDNNQVQGLKLEVESTRLRAEQVRLEVETRRLEGIERRIETMTGGRRANNSDMDSDKPDRPGGSPS